MMEILSWGANTHGQLGQGVISEQCNTPQDVIQTWNGNVKDISGGGAHTLLIDDNGYLYACGWNYRRQLGFESNTAQDIDLHTFTRVWELSGISFDKICCGWDSSAGISDKQVLYLWGSNSHGQLGLPKEHFPSAMRPLQLELKAKSISMGMRHTILVDINGCVWSTGCGKRGQLGLGESVLSLDVFNKLPNIRNIENAVCGQHHTIAWSKIDCVFYSWGDNTYGQLGLEKQQFKRVYTPTKITFPIECIESIIQIYSGWTHNAVLLNDGRAVYWGRNNYGQLGCSDPHKEFNVVEIPGCQLCQLSLGSEHSVCLTKDNSVWSWGWNEHGNTGTDIINNVTEPLKVKINCKNVQKLYTGAGHNFLMAS